MKAQRLVWALNRLPRFGIQTFKRLQEKKLDLSQCEDSEVTNLLTQIHPDFAFQFTQILNSSAFESDLEQCYQAGIQIISFLDSDYPKNLSVIHEPPLIFYMKGNLISEDECSVAIVGSRYPSAYGIRITAKFSSELSERGVTIVSGLARGIDAEAHRGALRAKGRTIAVLGCGLDIIYPKEHAALYEQIAENGAVISEFPLGTVPKGFNFPQRNRIITGLSLGILVVEANHRSGSLITASIAAEEGREVYAIPGHIDMPTAQGTNHLIQNGAKLVTSPDDILVDLHPQLKASVKNERHYEKAEGRRSNPDSKIASVSRQGGIPRNDSLEYDPVDQSLLKLLTNKPLSFDEIIAFLGEVSAGKANRRLAQLEMRGAIKRLLGGQYVRNPNTAIT